MEDKQLLEKLIKNIGKFITKNKYFYSHLTAKDKEALLLYFMIPFMGVDNINQFNQVWNSTVVKIYRVMGKKLDFRGLLREFAYEKIFKVISENQYRENKSKHIIYVICDATLCGKHYGENIDYISKRYDSSDNSYKQTNELVCFYCVINNLVFYFDIKLWKSREEVDYQPGTELFLQMLRDLEEASNNKGLKIQEIRFVVDGGFVSKEIIDEFNKRGLTIIGKGTDNYKGYSEQLGMEITFKDLRKMDFNYKILSKDNTEYKSLRILLKNDNKKEILRNVKIIICKLTEEQEKTAILLCNKLDFNALQIINSFRVRWKIETGFKELKTALLFEEYHFHNKKYNPYPEGNKIQNHFILRLILLNILHEIKRKYIRKKESIFEIKNRIKRTIFQSEKIIDTMFSIMFKEINSGLNL